MNENEQAMKEAEIEKEYWEMLSKQIPTARKRKLPSIVEQFVNSAAEVSYYNEVPAALAFFVLLGQISKDLVAIPFGRRMDDTRIQVVWMQTSGTGKSELYNFFGPITNYVFEVLNAEHGTNFNIMNVKETTDAALIGSVKMEKDSVQDDEGQSTIVEVPVQIYGALEGDGLCAYDEFEYSGVFKPSQHKENVVMYLNTFMNSIHGENWIITKKLRDGGVLECKCQRSLLAMTYIPLTMTRVIAETGLMQRSVLFIREIPIERQNELRRKVASTYGKIVDRETPVRQFGDSIIKIYDSLKQHYEESGSDATKTITYDSSFSDAIVTETQKFEKYVQSSRPAVLALANNFITRMQGSMARIAVLCCIAESPNIRTKSKRYIVNAKHVQQSSHLVRECYKSLVSWLDVSLRKEYKGMQDAANIGSFRKCFDKLVKAGTADTEGRVNKATLLEHVRRDTKRGQSMIYVHYRELMEDGKFSETKKGRTVYTKLEEQGSKEK